MCDIIVVTLLISFGSSIPNIYIYQRPVHTSVFC